MFHTSCNGISQWQTISDRVTNIQYYDIRRRCRDNDYKLSDDFVQLDPLLSRLYNTACVTEMCSVVDRLYVVRKTYTSEITFIRNSRQLKSYRYSVNNRISR
jgi:hypothetical protein